MKNDRGGSISAEAVCLTARSTLPEGKGTGCLAFVQSGSVLLRWAQGERVVNPGSVLLLGRQSYELQPAGRSKAELLVCRFPLELVSEQRRGRLFGKGGPLRLQGSLLWNARMRTLLEVMAGACQEPDCPGRLYLALLLYYVEQEAEKSSAAAAPRNETVEQICIYLAANYQKKLSLGEVAAKFYLSPYYLSRLFRRVTGQSIVDYINARRIEAAQRLLEDSDMKINAVAEATGFTTAAHFRRVFRESLGVGPAQYRKAYRGEED